MKTRLKIFTTVLSVLACCAFLPATQAQLPPEIPGNPDGCYPAFNTAEGCNALFQVTGGIGNTAIGWFSNFLAGNASFNTSVGAGSLALDSGVGSGQNTALGTAAMILNLSGSQNVAVGSNALVNNMVAGDNNAVGSFALYNNDSSGNGFAAFNNAHGRSALFANVDGDENEAFGDLALTSNVSGSHNVAIGDDALVNADASDNTAVGREAGNSISTSTNNVLLGDFTGTNLVTFGGNIYIGSGVSGPADEVAFIRIGQPAILGFPYDTYIAGIFDRGVDAGTAVPVFADANQKIGTVLVNANGSTVPFKPQAMLDESLKQQKRIAELEGMVTRLAATVNEQGAQIQKVSAQLEVSKPAPHVVTNKP
jgi:hypothetical protein